MEGILFSVPLGRFFDILGLVIIGGFLFCVVLLVYLCRPKQEVEFRRYVGPSLFQRLKSSRLGRWYENNLGVSDETEIDKDRLAEPELL